MKAPYIYKATLVNVVDGDTFDFDIDLGFHMLLRNRLRLYAVDTPELKGPNADPRGKDAREFSSAWLKTGIELFIHSHKYDAREKYGRVLGEVYRDEDPVPLGMALRDAGFLK